jgi:chaperonin GroEL (HSP60 family)
MIAKAAVKAMLEVAEKDGERWKVDVDDVKVEKKTGESLGDTSLIKGIVLDKEVVHSGMPKRIEKAKIALLDASLENEKTEFDAKINIESPEQMEGFLKQEYNNDPSKKTIYQWIDKYGYKLDAFFPVVDTEIGRTADWDHLAGSEYHFESRLPYSFLYWIIGL